MSTDWSSERLKKASIGLRTGKYQGIGKYEAIPATPEEERTREIYPSLFRFEAISIGDDTGQAFLVPLDESSKKTAEYILRAIADYKGV